MFLRDIWYFACPAESLRAGGMQHKVLLGEPIVIGREADGTPFALRDICPHRGVPLSSGKLMSPSDSGCNASALECPYHGWKFKTDGSCAEIPSLVPGQDMEIDRIRVRAYPIRETQGNIWIYMASDANADVAPTINPPSVPHFENGKPGIRETMSFSCHIDHAVIGLMDPAHGPFVHGSWWWRSSSSIHEKAKDFAPNERGFTMVAHAPSKNSGAYKILGGAPVTEIAFQLPGIRIETIRTKKHTICGLTTVTPIDENHTEITQTFYWTIPFMAIAKPLARLFLKSFLRQDRDMVNLQQEGLQFEPRLMLINDSDVQAKWYHRLKSEWAKSSDDGTDFINPIEPVTLRWRS